MWNELADALKRITCHHTFGWVQTRAGDEDNPWKYKLRCPKCGKVIATRTVSFEWSGCRKVKIQDTEYA